MKILHAVADRERFARRQARAAVEDEVAFLTGRLAQLVHHGADVCVEGTAALHAAGQHIRIELNGPPIDVDCKVRALCERALETAFADIAPGADHVGYDVDLHGPK